MTNILLGIIALELLAITRASAREARYITQRLWQIA